MLKLMYVEGINFVDTPNFNSIEQQRQYFRGSPRLNSPLLDTRGHPNRAQIQVAIYLNAMNGILPLEVT